MASLADYFSTLYQSRPTIEPSSEVADCGYVCISAVLALLGRQVSTEEIKRLGGTTSRGLTLKQVRDALRACGVDAEVIFFDRRRRESFPRNGIVLLTEGHYVVTCRRRRDRVEMFDPQVGWVWTGFRRLSRRCGGLGIDVRGLTEAAAGTLVSSSTGDVKKLLRSVLKGRSGRFALAIFALAQIITLALPLLSMWSVNRSVAGVSVSMIGAIAIGFVALSLTNIFITLIGDLAQSKTRRLAAVALSRVIFDSLASKPAYWFETSTSAGIHNRVASLSALLDFSVELVRTAGVAAVTFVVGVLVLFVISPWLLLPGFLALLLSIALDLAFERLQRSHFASVLETGQRRQWFVMDTLSQLPVISRFGALAPARVRFASVTRSAEVAQARLKSLRGWQAALRSLAKSGETLLFVTIAAAFMGAGNFTVGAFVALGAYKDLLANAISSIFALHIERRTLEVHRLQASGILTSAGQPELTCRTIENGEVEFRQVSFAYGTLDRKVVDKLDFVIRPSECVIIRGPSGSGKSTIAKLLTGQLRPAEGIIEVDGAPLADTVIGMAAVLQSDRLIAGSIRENVAYFRRGVSDDEIFEALRIAAIDDFVLRLPMRLSTQIGEGMAGLSGGQRQRILIARAALGRPRLLILDEATSSLEVEVESRIFQELRRSGATMLVLAHRPEVWALADRIYGLSEEGQLVEETWDRPIRTKSLSGRVA